MPCRPMNVASVTTIAGMLTQVTSQPWTSPNAAGDRQDQRRTPQSLTWPRAVGHQERCEHNDESGQSADREVDPADQDGAQLGDREECQDREEGQHGLDIER